mmetsp:Transcript_14484/g.16429  ORF Transcript_14484/g.16429 Transcript_14484/m.16429 type:complete len:252 (+) Transcript_14484:429-1184(+)
MLNIQSYSRRLSWKRFHKEFFLKQKPVLIRNGLPDLEDGAWNWTPKVLLSRYREVLPMLKRDEIETEVLIPKRNNSNIVSQWSSKRKKLDTLEVLKRFQENHLKDNIQARLEPSLFWREHESLPNILQSRRSQILYQNSLLFLTSPGLRTPLHSDEDNGLLMHLSGRKTVLLVSPKTSDKHEIIGDLMKYRHMDGRIKDLYEYSKDELIGQVHKAIFKLNPGDILFIPKRWLHDIESETTTASLAVRFRNV